MNIKKKISLALIIPIVGALAIPTTTNAYVQVDGYWSGGTYVESHVRSESNGIRYDNYGYDGGSLYNDSYSDPSYDSDWRTPSWETDPDYYTGESLYESDFGTSYDYDYHADFDLGY